MDQIEFFKNVFQNLHRDVLDKNYKKKSLLGRRESLIYSRRQTRDTLRFQKRNIDINMSPFITPQSTKKKESTQKQENEVAKKKLELLKQWKEKRNKQKEEAKRKAKPVFKVFHIDRSIGLPNLDNVNKEIKGKLIKSISNSALPSFAPANHKFNPPKNIKPINLSSKPVAEKAQNNAKAPMKKSTRNNALSTNSSHQVSRTNVTSFNKILPNPVKNGRKVVNCGAGSASNVKKTNVSEKKISSTGRNANILKPVNSSIVAINSSDTKKKDQRKKTVGWGVQTTSDDSSICYEKPGKKYQKTPRKMKVKNNSPSTNQTPTNTKQTEEFDPFYGRYLTPMPKKIPNEDESSQKQYHKNVADSYKTPDRQNTIEPRETDDEKIVIYDDEELTLKTPVKRFQTPKPTPRPSSTRKTLGRKEDCVVCLDCPANNKNTPVANRTPRKSSRKSARKQKEKLILEENRISGNDCEITKTPSSEKHTPKSGKKSEKPIGTPVYISPFVTISRGKDTARREFQIRKSTGGTFVRTPDGRDFTDTTSPQAGAEYFEQVLEREISRIQTLCSNWDEYKEQNDTSEETDDMINVAIGQSKLLISKKFEQFRSLIAQCKSAHFDEKPITCEDLHGFWDMIYHTVLDLDKRFDNLERLKQNGWEEIVPAKKVVQKRGRGKAKTAAASSSLKEMIKAARSKAQKKEENAFEIKLLQPKTPENLRKMSPARTGSGRRSLRVSLLKGPTVKRISSPGLTMMKVTQAIKAGDGLTPGKSILKTDLTKSAKRHTKSVLFIDDSFARKVNFSPENKENDPKRGNVDESGGLFDSPVTVRRSKRISKI